VPTSVSPTRRASAPRAPDRSSESLTEVRQMKDVDLQTALGTARFYVSMAILLGIVLM
jgi:hypothetical protein